MSVVTTVILDFVAIFTCYLVAVLVRVGGRIEAAYPEEAIAVSLIAAALQVAGNAAIGTYRRGWPNGARPLLLLLVPAVAVGLLVVLYDARSVLNPIPYGSVPVAVAVSMLASAAIHLAPRWPIILRAVARDRDDTFLEPLPSKASDFTALLIAPDAPIRDAIRVIDRDVARIALVIDEERHLRGVVTDGDVRRAILSGMELTAPVTAAMTSAPVLALEGASDADVLALMRERTVRQIPLVDPEGRVVEIKLLDLLHDGPRELCPVLIMAGGLGQRLGDLTRNVPKPLMRIAGRPILEMIVRDLASQGFGRIVIAVNYRAELIEEHFGDGRRFGMEISYVREDEPLGTAGAIRLARAQLSGQFIVTNADLLTRVNFRELLSFHQRQQHELTVAVIESTIQLRYGLVETKGSRVTGIREKPSLKHFVNAGIYVLEEALVPYVPEGTRFDMNQLIEVALKHHRIVGCFPVHEYWTDIGEPEDLRRATEDYKLHVARPNT